MLLKDYPFLLTPYDLKERIWISARGGSAFGGKAPDFINNFNYGQADRLISIGMLSTLRHLHIRPINLVVSEESYSRYGYREGIPDLGVGFPLRCFQRLSLPNMATQRCDWRHNWNTRGSSIPVLSYWGQLPSSILRPRQIGTKLSHDVLNPARVPL